MPIEPPTSIRVMRHFHVSPMQVFDAWLNPHTAGHWLFATPSGKMARVEIDPRIGGEFTIVDQRPEGEAAHFGSYTEMERPRRLAFTFSVEKYGGHSSQVTIDIEPSGDHECDLLLTNSNVPPEYAERTTEGWNQILEGLSLSLDRLAEKGK